MATKAAASNGHKLVTLTELLALEVPFEEVVVPEYGVKVVLHAVTGTERQRLADLSSKDETTADRLEFIFELVAASLGDGATPEQVGKLPGVVIDHMRDVALRLTGFGPEANAAVEAELKGTPDAVSG